MNFIVKRNNGLVYTKNEGHYYCAPLNPDGSIPDFDPDDPKSVWSGELHVRETGIENLFFLISAFSAIERIEGV